MSSPPQITIKNIEDFRGNLTLKLGDLPYELWDVFDKTRFDLANDKRLIEIAAIVSEKNELLDPKFVRGEKPDPRNRAFGFMLSAARGHVPKREPLKVRARGENKFVVIDGNATVQVLMLVGWKTVPIEVIDTDPP